MKITQWIIGLIASIGIKALPIDSSFDLLTTSEGTHFYSEKKSDQFNIFRHHGGHGPYIEDTGFGIERGPPENCIVDHAQIVRCFS